jgi:type I restriction enzyme S subunit
MDSDLKRLGDVAEIVGGGTPSTKQPGFWDGEIPWLTPKDLSSFSGIYIEKGARSITSEGLRASSARILPAGSVLYTSRAPIGYVAIAKNPVATNQGFKSFVLKEDYVPEFLFYLLKASKAEIESHASGGTFAEISARAIADVTLPFPSIERQRAIANLLSSLDMKLEINRNLSKCLESIAQAIFKSWFIDFDPVHTKARGEQPEGLDTETAALFPDSFEESELGLIPERWLASNVGESVNLTMGQSPPGTAYNEEGDGLPFFQGRTDFGERFPSRRVFSTQGNRLASAGDTLLSVRAPVGGLNQALETCIVGRGLAALRHKSNSESFTFCLARALGPQLQPFNGEGSVFGAINRKDLQALRFVEPPAALVANFEEVTGSMNEQIRTLHEQSLSLVSLRDSLLPRLISGELEIPDELLVH